MFTKAAVVELGLYGIRVNCVTSCAIEIELTRQETRTYSDTSGAAKKVPFSEGAKLIRPYWPHESYDNGSDGY